MQNVRKHYEKIFYGTLVLGDKARVMNYYVRKTEAHRQEMKLKS